jgi:hypothetical protein
MAGSDRRSRALHHAREGVAAVDTARSVPLPGTQPPFHPFRLGCRRLIDSGFYAGVGKLREQRVLAVDPAQGLVLLALTIDHPGNIQMLQLEQAGLVPVPEAFRLPNSYLRAVLVKVLDGRIRHVEILRGGTGWTTAGWVTAPRAQRAARSMSAA